MSQHPVDELTGLSASLRKRSEHARIRYEQLGCRNQEQKADAYDFELMADRIDSVLSKLEEYPELENYPPLSPEQKAAADALNKHMEERYGRAETAP